MSNTFNNVVSHLDISETLLTYLSNYLSDIPDISTSLGSNLFPDSSKKENIEIAFMNDNRDVVDYLSDDYFLSENNLYKINSTLDLTKIDNPDILNELKNKLNTFTNISRYTCSYNKIIPDSTYCRVTKQKLLFAKKIVPAMKIEKEYYNLTEKIPIPNDSVLFNIRLQLTEKEKLNIVFQITNSKDSLLRWENLNNQDGNLYLQAQTEIPKFAIPDSMVFFQTYIWNQKKKTIEIKDVELLVRKTHSSIIQQKSETYSPH